MNTTNSLFKKESQLWTWVEQNCDKCKKGSHPKLGSCAERTKCICHKARELYARLDNEYLPVRITTARVCKHRQCPDFVPMPIVTSQTVAPTLFDNY